MKKLKNKLFLILIMSFVSNVVVAHDIEVVNADGKTIYYKYSSDMTEVYVTYQGSSYGKYSGAINIPESVTYNGKIYPVTSINVEAFKHCSGLTSVTIPNSVTTIGSQAFSGCSALTSVAIGNSVTSIGSFAFTYCTGLTSVTIPNSVTTIGSQAFSGCSALTSVAIGNSVTSIGWYVFGGCAGLTSVTIPNSVTSIDGYAFADCSGLTSVNIPNSVTSIGSSAFYKCSGLTSVTIPNSVTSIGSSAFYKCSGLTSIIVENGNKYYDSRGNCNAIIETSNNTLIVGCNKTTIPNSVTSIGDGAFLDCTGLTSATIPNSATSIGDFAFEGCSGLVSVTIGNSVTSIGNYAFEGCTGLTSATIPNSVTTIGDNAFSGCYSLDSVTIGNSVTSIGNYAFNGCTGLTSATIPNSVMSIGNYAFSGCSDIASVTIGNSVTSIGDYAFNECAKLTSIVIPNSVINIGQAAFRNCIELASANLGDGIINIGNIAFAGCSALASITLPNNLTSIGDYAFSGCSGLNSIKIPNLVKEIGKEAFKGCSNITSAVIGNSVSTIYAETFRDCSKLSTITIGTSVKTIGSSAFSGCLNLKKVVVQDIASWCNIDFQYHNSNPLYYAHKLYKDENTEINNLTIPSSVTTINNYTFKDCYNIESVIISNSVTNIGDYAFSGCSNMNSLTIGNSVGQLGEYSFSGCESLTDIIIPNSVKTIKSSALKGCTSLKSIYIGTNVSNIYSNVFEGCSNISSIVSGITEPKDLIKSVFDDVVYSNAQLVVPEGCIPKYIACYGWKDFVKIVDTGGNIVSWNTLILPNLTAYVGLEAVLNIGLENDDAITGVQFNLTLPDGITVAENSKGKLMFSKTDRDEDHTLNGSKNADGSYTILLFSNDSEEIIGGQGDILGITLDVSKTLPEGEYEIKLSNIVLSTTNAEKITIDDITNILSVVVMKGDVNNDGEIDVVDVTAVANYILGQQPTSFMIKAADADNDGVIDVNDIVSIANIILYGNTTGSNNTKRKAMSSTIMQANNDGIFAKNITMHKGETSTLDFELVNMDNEYSGVQFEIQLPEGLNFALNNKGKVKVIKGERLEDEEFTLSVVPQGENRYKVLGYYADASSIPEHEGTLFSLSLQAEDSVSSGEISCYVKEIVLSTPNAKKIQLADQTFTVTISESSGITNVKYDKNHNSNLYDISGRKLPYNKQLPQGIYILNGKKIIIK